MTHGVRGTLAPLAVSFAVASLVGLGCGGESPEASDAGAWSGTIDTSEGGRVTVENTGGGAWERDTVPARRTLLVGEAGISGGSEATTFGDIIGLAVDGRGRIFVGDRMSSTVRAFGPDGTHLGLVGGEGRGPGEFRWPDGLEFGPGGWLYVAELGGITVMGNPAGGRLPTHQIDVWRTVAYPQIYRPFRVTCDGTVYYPHDEMDPTRHFYLRYRRDGMLRDTVPVPRLSGLPDSVPFFVNQEGGHMLRGVDHPPLAAIPSWDVTPSGRLLLGEARRYRLLAVAPKGDSVRVVRRTSARRPIPEAVRRESAQALRARLDTLPVAADEVFGLPEAVADVELPRRYPAHGDVRTSASGRIWVERPPIPGRPDVTRYDVFDRRGVYLGALIVPDRFDDGRGYTLARSRPRPIFTDSAVYGVVVDSVTGVQQVARFSYELPAREDGAPPPPARPCTGEPSPSE